jgi:hypothetical protein
MIISETQGLRSPMLCGVDWTTRYVPLERGSEPSQIHAVPAYLYPENGFLTPSQCILIISASLSPLKLERNSV